MVTEFASAPESTGGTPRFAGEFCAPPGGPNERRHCGDAGGGEPCDSHRRHAFFQQGEGK